MGLTAIIPLHTALRVQQDTVAWIQVSSPYLVDRDIIPLAVLLLIKAPMLAAPTTKRYKLKCRPLLLCAGLAHRVPCLALTGVVVLHVLPGMNALIRSWVPSYVRLVFGARTAQPIIVMCALLVRIAPSPTNRHDFALQARILRLVHLIAVLAQRV
jgi:hypothetical protein